MHVTIDRSACISCGACWNICPEIFRQNPCDLFSQVVEAYQFCGDRAEGIAPADLVQCVQQAAELCPVEIISTGDC